MTTAWKLDRVREIERTITLPVKNHFVKNETSIRLCYCIGFTIKYINLSTLEEAAIFFKKHGIISFYARAGNKIKMYRKSFNIIQYGNGAFVMREKPVPVSWNEINLLRSEVLWFCAYHEFEVMMLPETLPYKLLRGAKQLVKQMFPAVKSAA